MGDQTSFGGSELAQQRAPQQQQQQQQLPSPPFVAVPNLNNLRDAALACGGLVTSDGRKLRSGVLFRSAEVSKLDAEGWKTMGAIGVGHVFDLRSKSEVEKGWAAITGDKQPEDVRKGWEEGMRQAGVERSWVPVFEDQDYNPERLAQRYMKYMDESVNGFVQAYHDIATHAGPAFRKIFLYLASLPPADQQDGKSVGALIHCTAGKDRTGMFFGLLLSCLGVPRQQIAEEYNLTELGLAHIHADVVPRVMASPGFKMFMVRQMKESQVSEEDLKAGLGKAGDSTTRDEDVAIPEEVLEMGRQAAKRMLGARKQSMLGALDMVDREWGGAEAYMRKVCGLGDEEISAFKKTLVVSP